MRRRAALGGVLALALAACGKTGAPVAPETRRPLPVADLAAEARAGAIALTWTNPDRRVDGSRLRDLARARLYRAEDAGDGEPRAALLTRGRIPGYVRIADIPLPGPGAPVAPPPGVAVDGRQVGVVDTQGLAYGRRYTYVVVLADDQGRESAPSPRLPVAFIPPPAVPPRLEARAGDGEVHLRWQRPATAADGGALRGEVAYDVLRAPAPDAPLVVVATTAADETAYVDRAVENDRTYAYAVRGVRREAGTTARGPATATVTATPRDLTPPSPPRDLVAVPVGRDVRLLWRGSPEPDVAGYAVYRALGTGDLVRIATTTGSGTAHVDRGVPPGTYRYAVSALDGAAPPNESALSEPTTVAVP